MKRPIRYLLTYLICLPADLVCWIVVLAIQLINFRTGRLFWNDGLWCEIGKKRWFGMVGGIMAHGGWYAKDRTGGTDAVDTQTEFHEHFHVAQFEANMLRQFLIAASALIAASVTGHTTFGLWFAGILWGTMGTILWTAPGWIQAWLRGEKMYRGSVHERGAYSAAEEYARKRMGIR